MSIGPAVGVQKRGTNVIIPIPFTVSKKQAYHPNVFVGQFLCSDRDFFSAHQGAILCDQCSAAAETAPLCANCRYVLGFLPQDFSGVQYVVKTAVSHGEHVTAEAVLQQLLHKEYPRSVAGILGNCLDYIYHWRLQEQRDWQLAKVSEFIEIGTLRLSRISDLRQSSGSMRNSQQSISSQTTNTVDDVDVAPVADSDTMYGRISHSMLRLAICYNEMAFDHGFVIHWLDEDWCRQNNRIRCDRSDRNAAMMCAYGFDCVQNYEDGGDDVTVFIDFGQNVRRAQENNNVF